MREKILFLGFIGIIGGCASSRDFDGINSKPNRKNECVCHEVSWERCSCDLPDARGIAKTEPLECVHKIATLVYCGCNEPMAIKLKK